MAVEARYVGTLGRGIWRGIDYNQVIVARARSSTTSCGRGRTASWRWPAGRVFDPAFNPAIAGSQPLTYITQFGGGSLDQRHGAQQHPDRPGRRARRLLPGVAGAAVAAQARAAFYGNSGIYAADNIINGGVERLPRAAARDRGAASATASSGRPTTPSRKTLIELAPAPRRRASSRSSTTPGRSSSGRARSSTSRTCSTPTRSGSCRSAKGKRWLDQGGVLNALVGGWQLSGIVHWQSGIADLDPGAARHLQPQRRARPATWRSPTLTRDEIQELIGIFKQPDGSIYFIDPKVIDPATGRGVGADTLGNAAGFPGQVFFNPAAGRGRHAAAPVARRAVHLPARHEPQQAAAGSAAATRRSSESRRSTCSTRRSSISRTRTSTARRSGASTQLEPNATGSRVLQLALKFNF